MDKTIIGIVVSILCIVLGVVFVVNMITTVDADEIVVKQNALDGQLQVWSDPGVHWQNFGRLTVYKKSAQYWFSARELEGKKTDESIQVRFNDGGHGNVSGSLRYNMPTDPAKLLKLHSTYRSMAAIDHELVRQVVNKSVYMTGPLMSSRESYAEKRADLINFISDQITNGVYQTERHLTKITDIVSGQEKNIEVVRPKVGKGPNGIDREEVSPIDSFGMTVYNITINQVAYDPEVEGQIKQQQQATMAVQQAMVDARKAEQKALTVAKEGEAKAAEAKWAQEVEKAKAVTTAEQGVAVAKLELETSKLNREKDITTAQGEAEAKRLALNADGALQVKINAWIAVNTQYAAALAAHRLVPDIQMGPAAGGTNATGDLMQMLQISTAKQLQLNLAAAGK